MSEAPAEHMDVVAPPAAESIPNETHEELAVNAAEGEAPEAAAVAGAGQVAEGDSELFAYTRRNEFTSEIFKINIENLQTFVQPTDLKKILAKLKLDPVKVKKAPGWKHAYVTFRNEEQRAAAIAALDGFVHRGQTLRASPAAAMADPYHTAKRGQAEGGRDNKRARKGAAAAAAAAAAGGEGGEPDTRSLEEKLNDKVTPLWRLSYEEQLAKKHDALCASMRKIADQLTDEFATPEMSRQIREHKGLPCAVAVVVPSLVTQGYRNKCEFAIGDSPDGKAKTIGFMLGAYMQGSVVVGSPAACVHVSDVAKKVAVLVQRFIEQSPIPAYDRVTHEGNWRQLTVRTPASQSEALAILSLHGQGLSVEDINTIESTLRTHVAEERSRDSLLPPLSLLLQIDSSMSGVGTPELSRIVTGKNYFTETVLGLRFRVSPDAFFQINTGATERLLGKIREWISPDLRSDTVLLDVCCGTGMLGLCLAETVREVVGVELVASAIEDAKRNAEENGIANVKYVASKAEDFLPNYVNQPPHGTHVVGIVDPPRNGLHPKVVAAIRRCTQMTRLVYVSCSIDGAAQNIVNLCRPTTSRCRGPPFRLEAACPVDMFPHTDHCEMLMLLTRESPAPNPASALIPAPAAAAAAAAATTDVVDDAAVGAVIDATESTPTALAAEPTPQASEATVQPSDEQAPAAE